jgi:hypothetical protein
VSKLIGLYSELYSKVVSRSDLKVFAEQYKLFEKYHDRPELLLAEADMSQYAKMERLVGEALEKLKITTFEGML